jgi:glutathione peroxidase-family protein
MTDLYDLTMTSITGEQIDLADFRDRVLLIVNVATN